MKSFSLALAGFLAAVTDVRHAEAFTPSAYVPLSRGVADSTSSFPSFITTAGTRQTQGSLSATSGFLGEEESSAEEEDDDEDFDSDDEDEDEDDDDIALTSSRYSSAAAKSPFTGIKLDPWDPNPLIKPRPSRYFKDDNKNTVPDDQLVQTMSQDERGENLKIMRQIKKHDLRELRMRKDHAGWVEANNDLKRRFKKDPWYGINERLQEAIQMGHSDDKVEYLQKLAERVGGPPPGITVPARGYVVHTDLYDVEITASRATAVMERQVREERAARGRAMMAERKRNMEKEQRQMEEDLRAPGLREEREAKERRERTMKKLLAEIAEDNKKKAERAKELLGKVPDAPETRTKAMDKALSEARDEVKKQRRKMLGKPSSSLEAAAAASLSASDSDSTLSGADAARAQAASEASGGRPRLPGDPDVSSGVIAEDVKIEPSSTTVTGPLQVEISSVYNYEQSDPPMRKHSFQYTIRITNNSDKDTIQLLGRRFEIQTVASSMKDVVQGEGVTGRTPILKPGEVFEYTSTAPLSVRPIATTIIAARMQGEYRYVTLKEGQNAASEEQIKAGGDGTAALGMFHFIFPEDQRVQPYRSADNEDDDDEDEDEDDDDDDEPVSAKKPSTSTTTPTPYPTTTLPGDQDMISGDVTCKLNDSSEDVSDQVRVTVSSTYRPERSDEGLDKHVFAYNIRITNESKDPIQLVSRRFEIQTIGSPNKEVIQGAGVTGRQPVLKPGESFEYTSTAPLNVKPMLNKTPVVGRMQGDYSFLRLAADGTTPLSSEPLKAKLGLFHFILPALI
jgi:ApaG protein